MDSLLTATIGAKGQITLPKKIRQFLKIEECGDLVGFAVDEEQKTVRLTKLRLVSEEEEFSEEDYARLLDLPQKKGGKTFSSMKGLIEDLKLRS